MLELILTVSILLLILQYCIWLFAVLADAFPTRNDAYAFLIPFNWLPKIIKHFITNWNNLP
jgi:hypothetical protein